MSPKSPIRTDDSEIDFLLESVKKRLERLAAQIARNELSDIINSDSNVDRQERKEMTKEKLGEVGAVPKLAFCRLENFRLMRVLGVGSYGKVFLVRMKSHRILPDSLYPKRFPPINKNMEQETTSDFWPEGLSGNSDLCSKYWLPRVTGSEEDTMFRPYYAMKVIPKRMVKVLFYNVLISSFQPSCYFRTNMAVSNVVSVRFNCDILITIKVYVVK